MTKTGTILFFATALAVGDPSPITMTMTPTNGSVVSGTITVSCTVTSSVAPIQRVEFYRDGVMFAVVTNPFAPPTNLRVK